VGKLALTLEIVKRTDDMTDIPLAILLLADRQGHDLSTGLDVQGR
jgi:hypothetical protein